MNTFIDKLPSLPQEVANVIVNKGTEPPFSGEYNHYTINGSYLCRRCGLALYRADTKFTSQCGWPSFDAAIPDTVKQQQDADGRRTEIVCERCNAHLGHVFHGEGYTQKNIRYCVNSLAVDFVANQTVLDTEEIIVAGGCFWGVEYFFEQLSGVIKTEVGYTSGQLTHPTYHQVCEGNTGHLEACRIVYDPAETDLHTLYKYFFEIHDPTTANGQGPDIGEQYLSAIFFYNEYQEKVAKELVEQLMNKNHKVATKILPISTFWKAEDYHQHYYAKHNKQPYCHAYVRRF